MAPRAYRMTRRAAANAETRRRIVDAAIALHAQKGVLGTSWPDIAKRADVALGTVYRHFPSLDQLVPACTSENALRTKPPGPSILVGLTRPQERIGQFVQELFAFYGRTAPWTPRAGIDRHEIPVLDSILSRREAALKALVEETLGPLRRRRHALEAALALTDFGVWRSLTHSGLSTEAAARLITEMLMTWLTRRSATR
ncbi:MAG: TetR/AcrR family transcriptional regulator [Chloroflexota bacterium]|nr:MAG: TetR/AcrR family transcriptional regulator [Chloroflexota bacterium]